jgi:hypothetical protein
MNSRPVRWILLTLAGIAAAILTWFGLMDFAFTDPGQDDPVAVALLWILPLFSAPLLVIYVVWKRVKPAVFWGFVACQWAAVSWLNLDLCLRKGGCTTSNPLLVVLGGAIVFPVWCWILIASLCQCEYRLRRKSDSGDDGWPAKARIP